MAKKNISNPETETETDSDSTSSSSSAPVSTGANEKILMTDGSSQEFSPKKKLIKEVSVDENGDISVKLFFRNGEVRQFLSGSTATTYAKAAAHGYSQKLGDECAGLDNIDDMVQAIDELLVRLGNGEWTGKRDGSAAGGSILARALVELTKKAEETDEQARERVKKFLATKTQAEKIALRNFNKLKPIVERLEAEKAAKSGKGIDAEALLGQLD